MVVPKFTVTVFEFRVDYGDAVKLPIHKGVPSSVRAISHPALKSGDSQFRGLRDCHRKYSVGWPSRGTAISSPFPIPKYNRGRLWRLSTATVLRVPVIYSSFPLSDTDFFGAKSGKTFVGTEANIPTRSMFGNCGARCDDVDNKGKLAGGNCAGSQLKVSGLGVDN